MENTNQAPWEFTSPSQMLSHLVGESFGPNPEQKIPEIKADKQKIAAMISSYLELKKTDTVLEIGSGCGFISAAIAPRVAKLYCCDVSQSFLDVAKKECSQFPNTEFFKVNNDGLAYLWEKQGECIDKVYSFNVFIHLDLFEIYTYFAELKRVLKPGGSVWFDFESTDSFINGAPELFIDMAKYYKTNCQSYAGLIKYNSPVAIEAIAKHCGFELAPQQLYTGSFHFIKSSETATEQNSAPASFRSLIKSKLALARLKI